MSTPNRKNKALFATDDDPGFMSSIDKVKLNFISVTEPVDLDNLGTTGNVTGVASSVVDNIVTWRETTGKDIKDSGVAISDLVTDTELAAAIGVTIQPYDADLNAIAGLTSAADKLPYATGSGTWDLTDITSFGRSLIDDSSASTARTTLGLVIGTNVQAYSADLASIAGLTSSANKFLYATGSNTWTLGDITSFGRSLIDDADSSAARTTLGLVIGTNVQPYDADLNAIAGLTSAADSLPYATGSETWALTDLTAFARTLLDDANASSARSTLGLSIGSDVQPYDADLNAIASLVSATDKFPYATGSETWTLGDITSFGRSLIDDADASTARTTLGVVIGTDVQAENADLTSIAGLTSAADKMLYATGASTWALADLTTFGRSLIDDADASTARTTLGVAIGTDVQAYDADTAKLDVAQAWTKGQRGTAVAMSIVTNEVDWNLADGNVHTLTATGNFTLNLPGDIASYIGQSGLIIVTQDATGSRTMAVESGIDPLNSDTLFDIASAANDITLIAYYVVNATTMVISGGGVGVAL